MTKEGRSPFELVVGDEDGKILNGDVAVRWCIDPTFIDQMTKDGVKDPHILLLTATPDGREMQRKLIPVGEVMTFARFTRAGKQSLHAWIVDGSDGRKALKNDFLGKKRGWWNTTLLSPDDGSPLEEIDGTYIGTSVDVILPEGVFGKEPSGWLKWYTNLFHSGSAVDQCNFRQRMLLAFTLKWIPVTAFITFLMLCRTIVVVGIAGLGFRKKVHPKYFFHPFDFPLDGLCDDWDANEWIPDQDYLIKLRLFNTDWRFITFIPFTPVVVGILALFTYLIGYDGLMWQEFFIEFGIVMYMATLLCFFIDVLIVCATWLTQTEKYAIALEWSIGKWERVDQYLTRSGRWPLVKGIGIVLLAAILIFLTIVASIVMVPLFAIAFGTWYYFRWVEKMMDEAIRMNDISEFREIFCPSDMANLKAKYALVPTERRTIRLWFEDLKNKVCKPMQM